MIVLIVIAAILGGILLLFLTLLAILLFVPFKANIFVSNSSKLTVKLKVLWLFGLIRVYYEKKGDKSRSKIKIFFITLGNKKKNRNKSKVKLKSEPCEEETPNTHVEEKLELELKPESKPKPESKSKPEQNTEKDGLMERITDAKGKFDYVYNHPDRDILIRLTVKLCMELLKALKPKSFCVKGEIGTGDPALTGQLLGAVYVVQSFTGLDLNIKGDFEKAAVNGEIIIESNICLYKFVVPLCKYALSKPVWKLIKKFIFRKDEKK